MVGIWTKRCWLALVIFVLLTFVLTYPLILNLGHKVRDKGDSLLNTWIMAWNIRKITHLDFKGFFEANIFYPSPRTLAYSEFLIPQSLLGLPVLLISGNPILAHNLVLLLAFITSGFAMFLLANYLTKNFMAGIIAGVIFAFSPFMMAHLPQIQVLSAGGIPLTFLFLHRYFGSHSSRDFSLFALFFILQALANGYYALYLTLFAGLFMLYQIFRHKLWFNRRFWLKISTFILLVAVTIGPFFYQYIWLRSEMGFSREIGFYARPANFLATAKINRLYGRLTQRFWSPEGELYPGAVAFLLGLAGLIFGVKIKKKRRESIQSQRPLHRFRKLKIFFNILIVIWLGLIIYVIFFGGFTLYIGKCLIVRVHRLTRPLLTLGILLILRVLIQRPAKINYPKFVCQGNEVVFIYTAILILAFLFSLGPKGPYIILYKYFPGFDGLRVISRFHILTMFSLAMLAAWGIKEIRQRFKGYTFTLVASLAFGLILAEYFSGPLPLVKVPVKEEIPEVYRWLATHKEENFAILELPLPRPMHSPCPLDCPRLYYSTYHWKNLVNGFSGYLSPLYEELVNRWYKNPIKQNIQDIKALGIRYLIIHLNQFKEEDLNALLEELTRLEPELHHVKSFGTVEVFEFAQYNVLPGRDLFKRYFQPTWLVHSSVRASLNEEQASAAVDGLLNTCWDSGQRKVGSFFEVDLGMSQRIKGISILLGERANDYPRGYAVEVSIDGHNWLEVAREENSRLPLLAYLQPKTLPFIISFPEVEARWIRITHLGTEPEANWSICELGIFKSATSENNKQ